MTDSRAPAPPRPGNWLIVGFAWLLVSLPLLWGIWQTVKKASVLFR
jgi:hypothetical protein